MWGSTNKFDLQKKEKNPTRQPAQKDLSNDVVRVSFVKMHFKMSIVMGNF